MGSMLCPLSCPSTSSVLLGVPGIHALSGGAPGLGRRLNSDSQRERAGWGAWKSADYQSSSLPLVSSLGLSQLSRGHSGVFHDFSRWARRWHGHWQAWGCYRKPPHETTHEGAHRAGAEDTPWHSTVSSACPFEAQGAALRVRNGCASLKQLLHSFTSEVQGALYVLFLHFGFLG